MNRLIVMAVIASVAGLAAPLKAGDLPFFAFKNRTAAQSKRALSARSTGVRLTAQLTEEPRLLPGPLLETLPTSGSFLRAQVPPPAPAAEGEAPAMPAPQIIPDGAPMTEAAPIALFDCVKYKDLHNVHPCAVTKIVAVKDPRACCDPCSCCEPGCVYIQICVPPCGSCKFEVKRRDHSKVEWDYGDYEVEVTSKNGVVYVDYDD